jgi:hypothetical protein
MWIDKQLILTGPQVIGAVLLIEISFLVSFSFTG